MKTICLCLMSCLFAHFSFSQEINLKPMEHSQGDGGSNEFSLQIFNNTKRPIAIKCSPSFFNFSMSDTLILAPITYRDSNVYRIDFSFQDSKNSEASMYHLLILNPQTSLATNIRLFNPLKLNHLKFELIYSKDVSAEEIETFTNREKLSLTKKSKNFLFKTVDIPLRNM